MRRRSLRLKNGGAREDSAIPARALLATEQGYPHNNYLEASIRWTRPRAWHCLRALYEIVRPVRAFN
jgi:hypothetical protein